MSRPSTRVAPASRRSWTAAGSSIVHRLGLGQKRTAVEGDDALEVRRLRRQIARERPHERFLVRARREAVEAALEADGRARLLAHPGAAAERAADVARPDLGEVAEREQALDRLVQAARAFLLVDREVGPGDVADEERVARDHEPGLVAPARVCDEVGGVLRAMPGRRERGHRDVADRDLVAVAERLVREVDAGRRRHVDRGAGCLREPPLAGDVVGMVVRLEDVRDREAVLLGQAKIVLDVPFRVDDGGLAAVGDDVGGAAQIVVQHLSEEHARPDDTGDDSRR